mgnify:FL=1
MDGVAYEDEHNTVAGKLLEPILMRGLTLWQTDFQHARVIARCIQTYYSFTAYFWHTDKT